MHLRYNLQFREDFLNIFTCITCLTKKSDATPVMTRSLVEKLMDGRCRELVPNYANGGVDPLKGTLTAACYIREL